MILRNKEVIFFKKSTHTFGEKVALKGALDRRQPITEVTCVRGPHEGLE